MWTGSILAVAAALAAVVEAQTSGTTKSSQATTTSTAGPTTYTILVGAEGFKYTPNEIHNVSVGDVLEFRFYPGNHTVARSDFGTPCIPYEYTGLNRQGFFSGYIAPQIITNDLPQFRVRVNDTAPIFFYCTAPGSCFQQHMIGVVNPNATETLDLQEQYAINATTQIAPGQPFPSETLNPTSTPTATGAGGAGTNSHGFSAGAIAGVAIGGVAVLVLAGALVFLCGRRGGGSLDRAYYRRNIAPTFPPPPMMAEEAKYSSHCNPKSPGQETCSTAPYSISAVNDPYRANSPRAYNSSSPPAVSAVTPPSHHPAYSTYSSADGGHPNVQSPLMAGMTDGTTQGYYIPGISPPPAEIPAHPFSQPAQAAAAAVELPTSTDSGNSPLPGYQLARAYSWSRGQETEYRPGSKA